MVAIRDSVKSTGVKMADAVKIFTTKSTASGVSQRRLKLALLLLAFVLQACVHLGKSSVDTLFLLGFPVCFTSVTLGFYQCILHLAHGLFAVVSVHFASKRCSDISMEVASCVSYVFGRLTFAFASSWQHILLSKCTKIFVTSAAVVFVS